MEKIEVWLPVRGYEGLYAVSNFGRVLAHQKTRVTGVGTTVVYSECIMKPFRNRYGYLEVGFRKDGNYKRYKVHRLVAEAFIPNPDNLPKVLHRDDNPANNCVDNLYFGTQADNMCDMASKNRQRVKKRPVVAILPDGSREYEFESMHEASRQTGVNQGNISNCCRGRCKTTGGLIWQYVNS